jgi:hypothetical protein
MRFWRSLGRPIPSLSWRSQPEWLPDLNRLVEAVKHVEAVSAGAKDPGSTPGASTNLPVVRPASACRMRSPENRAFAGFTVDAGHAGHAGDPRRVNRLYFFRRAESRAVPVLNRRSESVLGWLQKNGNRPHGAVGSFQYHEHPNRQTTTSKRPHGAQDREASLTHPASRPVPNHKRPLRAVWAQSSPACPVDCKGA